MAYIDKVKKGSVTYDIQDARIDISSAHQGDCLVVGESGIGTHSLSIDDFLEKIIVRVDKYEEETPGSGVTHHNSLEFILAKQMTDSVISSINEELSPMGITITRENFNAVMTQLLKSDDVNALMKNTLLCGIAMYSVSFQARIDDEMMVVSSSLFFTPVGFFLHSSDTVINIFAEDGSSLGNFESIELTYYTD